MSQYLRSLSSPLQTKFVSYYFTAHLLYFPLGVCLLWVQVYLSVYLSLCLSIYLCPYVCVCLPVWVFCFLVLHVPWIYRSSAINSRLFYLYGYYFCFLFMEISFSDSVIGRKIHGNEKHHSKIWTEKLYFNYKQLHSTAHFFYSASHGIVFK